MIMVCCLVTQSLVYVWFCATANSTGSIRLSSSLFAAIGAFCEAYLKMKPVILKPVITVEVVALVELQSASLSPPVLNILVE
jgi:hypothetical protein